MNELVFMTIIILTCITVIEAVIIWMKDRKIEELEARRLRMIENNVIAHFIEPLPRRDDKCE